MVASKRDGYAARWRDPFYILDYKIDDYVMSLDWNRILLQAQGQHLRVHEGTGENTCGTCLRSIMLRKDIDE
jgi:hypothetical protein